jgi:hypothetical protein
LDNVKETGMDSPSSEDDETDWVTVSGAPAALAAPAEKTVIALAMIATTTLIASGAGKRLRVVAVTGLPSEQRGKGR